MKTTIEVLRDLRQDMCRAECEWFAIDLVDEYIEKLKNENKQPTTSCDDKPSWLARFAVMGHKRRRDGKN